MLHDQFAQYIRDSVNPDAAIVHQAAVSDDPRKRKPDIARAKAVLGYGRAVSAPSCAARRPD